MLESKITKFAKEMADELLEGKSDKSIAGLSADEIMAHMDGILMQVENSYSSAVSAAVEEASEEAEVDSDEDWWEDER